MIDSVLTKSMKSAVKESLASKKAMTALSHLVIQSFNSWCRFQLWILSFRFFRSNPIRIMAFMAMRKNLDDRHRKKNFDEIFKKFDHNHNQRVSIREFTEVLNFCWSFDDFNDYNDDD